MIRRPPRSTRTDTLFPYTTLFRSARDGECLVVSLGQEDDKRIAAFSFINAGTCRRTACAEHRGEHESNNSLHFHKSLRSPTRSAERTSELQSLMRISYAVFCLKKKKQHLHSRNKYPHLTPTC